MSTLKEKITKVIGVYPLVTTNACIMSIYWLLVRYVTLDQNVGPTNWLRLKMEGGRIIYGSFIYVEGRTMVSWSAGWLVGRFALVRPNSHWSDSRWCYFHKEKSASEAFQD